MGRFVVIQDGWIPEPFETLKEARHYRDSLELESLRAGTTSRIHVYEVVV